MSTIFGRGGRVYRDGKLVDAVSHPELRSRSELAQARADAAPKPQKRFTGNPFEQTIALELKRHNILWPGTTDGQRVLGNLRKASEEWEADQVAKREQSEFAESVRPLKEHAEQQTQAVFDSPEYTVEEVEQAQAALASAKGGDREAYAAWEKSHHEKLLNKLATEAAGADSVAREASARRDAILKSGLEYKPTPIPEVATPLNPVPVDRSKVAITRKVATANGGTREVTTIEDA